MKYDIRIPVAERCLQKNNKGGGMQINSDAWHLRLFREAYIKNRAFWLDSPINLDYERPKELNELPEVVERRIAEEAWYEEVRLLSWKEFKEKSEKKHKEINLLRQKAREAQVGWLEEELKTRTARLSAELADKLEHGRMSLCPYFWSVVIAVLWYVPFVRNKSLIARGAISCLLGCLIFGALFVGYLGLETAWQKKENIARGVGHAAVATGQFATEGIGETVSQAVAAVSVMRAEKRIKKVAQENYEKKHAAEIAAAKAERAADEARRAAEDARGSQQTTWQDVKEIGWGILAVIGYCLGIFLVFGLGIAVSVGFTYLVFFTFSAIFKVLTPPSLTVWKILEGPETVNRWLAAHAAMQRFWSDTWSLITAFAKATKEQVCPFLVIVDED
jgi:hypothetical protein